MENNTLFAYGILKKGHVLDLRNHGATFLGEAHIEGATLYSIGGRGVGLRLTDDDSIAHGELWEIPDELWKWLDHIEGNGFNYERKIVSTVSEQWKEPVQRTTGGLVTTMAALDRMNYHYAWVYEHMYKGFTDKEKIEGGKF